MNQEAQPQNFWKKCSSCKKEIAFNAMYYVCSISTCKHKRTGFRFCSVPCWDAHLGFANHRESWAEEARAPSKDEYAEELRREQSGGSQERAPVKKIVGAPPAGSTSLGSAGISVPETDTLVVVSKVKALIKERSEFNVSQCCIDALTKKVAEHCLKAIDHARGAGRKTVMGRDV